MATDRQRPARSPERAPDDELEAEDERNEEHEEEERRRAADEREEDVDTGAEDDEIDAGGEETDDADAAAKKEARARKMGWVPKDEWRGKPGAWRPAEEFLERAASNASIFNERFEQMEQRHTAELTEVKTKLTEATDVLGEMHKRFKTADQKAYERARRDIEEEMKQAEEEEDLPRFKKAREKLDELDEEKPAGADETGEDPTGKGGKKDGADTQPQKPNPVIEAWRADNKWFDKDPELSNAAIHAQARIQREKPGLDLHAQLDLVSDDVRRRFPEKFENPRRRQPNSVGNPSGDRSANGAKKGRTYDDLPADAKAACDKFCRTIPGYTRKDYLKEYEWDSP